jgi:hypothetical protein
MCDHDDHGGLAPPDELCSYHPELEVHLQVVVGASLVDGHEAVDVDIVSSRNRWYN